MANYEYKVLNCPHGGSNTKTHSMSLSTKEWENELNELGQQGWKVVAGGGSGHGLPPNTTVHVGWVILMRESE